MATITAAAGGGNWTTGSTWVGGVAPTAADDAVLSGTSGNVTIDAGAVCRSLNATSGTGNYTGTLTSVTSVVVTIGDATAGAGNVALKFSSGMTYTLAGNAGFNFISTSATQQTVDFAAKTNLGNIFFAGAGSSYQLTANLSTAGALTHTAGTLDTNGKTVAMTGAAGFTNSGALTRTLTLGASAINMASATVGWQFSGSGLTITANTAVVTITGASAPVTLGASYNYNGMSMVLTGSGVNLITSSATLANFTRTGTAVKTDGITFVGDVTCTGTLTLTGNSAINRLIVQSSLVGTVRTLTVATVSTTNADFTDITAAGAAIPFTGTSIGDCGGNSNITFTTAAAQTWQGTAGGNWSDVTKWTSRVPLPQDDVIINAAFSASQTIAADMPRFGKSIDFTGATGSPTWTSAGTFGTFNFGSLTLISAMSITFNGGHTFAGRGTYTVTSAGKNFIPNMGFQAPGGTYGLQDAFSTTNTVTVNGGGTLNTNNNTITAATIQFGGVGTVCNLGSSTLNLTTTVASGYLFLRSNNAAATAGAATLNVVNATANERKIAASGIDFSNATLNYTLSGSTGTLYIEDTLNIGTLNFFDASNARTLKILAARTLTAKNFNVNGTPGNLISIISATPGTTASVSKSSGAVSCNYLSLQDSTATGGASWYAGINSVNVSNNTGWFFQDYSSGKFLEFI